MRVFQWANLQLTQALWQMNVASNAILACAVAGTLHVMVLGPTLYLAEHDAV